MSSATLAVLASWSFDPAVVLGLALAALLYAAGLRRLRTRSRVPIVPPWRLWCWFLGLAVVALALLSPIGTFGAALFFVHMIEHLLLLLVAPPLLWLGAPLLPLLWAFPRQERRALGRLFREDHPVHRLFHLLTDAWVTSLLFFVAVALWHLPRFYDAAQGVTAVHGLEHGVFFGAAMLYWWPVIHPTGGRRRLGYGMSLLYLFAANVEGIIIGAPLTFATHVVYAYYADVPRVTSLTALDDQELGGLIMWVPTSLYWLGALVAVLIRWFSQEQHLQSQLKRPAPSAATAEGWSEGTTS
jgi:cytochrome c oxidase assembly factor CtaG